MDYFLFNFSGVQFHYTMSLKIDFASHYDKFVVVVFCMSWSEFMRDMQRWI